MTTIATDPYVALGTSMAGTKSIVGGVIVGAGNTVVPGSLDFHNLVPMVRI